MLGRRWWADIQNWWEKNEKRPHPEMRPFFLRLSSVVRLTEPEQQARLQTMKQELNDWMRSVIHSLNGRDYSRIATTN